VLLTERSIYAKPYQTSGLACLGLAWLGLAWLPSRVQREESRRRVDADLIFVGLQTRADERLPEACRRLDLGATVFEVSRGEQSKVLVRRKNHPVDDYIDDAFAVMKSDAPSAAKDRVIPGLCRNAIEAACIEKARHKLITGGAAHGDVDALVDKAMTTVAKIGLALFGNLDSGGDVMPTLDRKFGREAADLIKTLRTGAHVAVAADPEALIRDTRKLAEALRDAK